jgi:hypothetical protein
MSKGLAKLLTDSARDLFRYKSFFLLVFVLIWADRLLKTAVPRGGVGQDWGHWRDGGGQLAEWVFSQLPDRVAALLTDHRTFIMMGALFLAKQLVSIWPSSDMRRMHRRERGRFGLLAALISLTGRQVAWDALAVGTCLLIVGSWALAGFGATQLGWHLVPSAWWLALLAGIIATGLPVAMAGFSYSSKIAVLSQGSFMEKLALFMKLFTHRDVLVRSWVFFAVRLVVEAVFVAVVPLLLLWSLDHTWLRIPLAAMVATPVYSYLKMLSFKFFLMVYGRFDLVRREYPDHFGHRVPGGRPES